MNPNLWGPDTWSVIHGLSFLYPSNSNIPKLLDCFSVVLPCIFCRQSFSEYFDYKEASESFSKGHGAEYVYLLHNKVNNKLEKQRLEKFILACQITDSNLIETMYKHINMLSSRPSFDIVKKRYNVRKDYPFSLKNVYMMMMCFIAVSYDDKDRSKDILLNVSKVMHYLGIIMNNKQFLDISTKMNSDIQNNLETSEHFYKYIYDVEFDHMGNYRNGWKLLRNNMHSYK